AGPTTARSRAAATHQASTPSREPAPGSRAANSASGGGSGWPASALSSTTLTGQGRARATATPSRPRANARARGALGRRAYRSSRTKMRTGNRSPGGPRGARPASFLGTAEGQDGVEAAEGEGVRQGVLGLVAAGAVGDDVEVALRVGLG